MTDPASPAGRVRLTANFYLDEFLVSDKARALGIANTPTPEHKRRLREVTAPGFQMIRDGLDKVITVHSGYRNPAVNAAVGGTETSDHPQAWCGDITAHGMTARALALWIAGQPQIMKKVDQLILETSRGVVHVSFNPRARGQVLTQPGGAGSKILKGIV